MKWLKRMGQIVTDVKTMMLGLAAGTAAVNTLPGTPPEAKADEQQPPNIIMIMADNLGWTDINCHELAKSQSDPNLYLYQTNPNDPNIYEKDPNGMQIALTDAEMYDSTYYKTTTLADLRKQSMRFTQAYAACPFCKATRASILTGKYPYRLRMNNCYSGVPLPSAETTIAEAIKEVNPEYKTGFFGKWQVNGLDFDDNISSIQVESLTPENQGFDAIHVTGEDAYSTKTAKDFLDKFAPGKDFEGKPFFMCVWYYEGVHYPVKENEYEDHFGDNSDQSDKHQNRYYKEHVYALDLKIGEILDKVKEHDLDEKTIIIFYSDNGGEEYLIVTEANTNVFDDNPGCDYKTDNYPLSDQMFSTKEGGIRVPLMIKWPGVTTDKDIEEDPEDLVCHTPVSSIDFFPTILQMVASENYKPEENYLVDGKSFVSCLEDPSATVSRDNGGLFFIGMEDDYDPYPYKPNYYYGPYSYEYNEIYSPAIRGIGTIPLGEGRSANSHDYKLIYDAEGSKETDARDDFLNDEEPTLKSRCALYRLYEGNVLQKDAESSPLTIIPGTDNETIRDWLFEKMSEWIKSSFVKRFGDSNSNGKWDLGDTFEKSFLSIEEAIGDPDTSNSDVDIILLPPATLHENITISKNIILQSEYPDDPRIVAATILDGITGFGDGPTVDITADDCTIQGITITGGYPGQSDNGSGVQANGANATIKNCILRNNQAGFGGALYGFNGLLENCSVFSNSAQYGGGLAGANSIVMINSIVSNNTAAVGGGMFYTFGDVTNCTIADNTATDVFGGFYADVSEPVAYWKFDETSGMTASDSSPNENDGTLQNTDPNICWVTGKIDNCLEFDGNDDYVEMSGYYGIGGTDARTTCAWIKLSSTGTVGTILSYGGITSGSGWLFLVDGNNHLQLEVHDANIIGDPVLSTGQWYHVAAVLDDWNSDGLTVSDLRLYIDGEQVEGTSTNPNTKLDTGDYYPVRIGTHPSVSYFFPGRIDDVRIYDHALSEAEIADIMIDNSGDIAIKNCIFWGNRGIDSDDIAEDQIYIGSSIDATLDYSCIEGIYTIDMGNISGDPDFVNEPNFIDFAPTDIAALPQAHWEFNTVNSNTTPDSSGNGHVGTLKTDYPNSPLPTLVENGRIGKCLRFNGGSKKYNHVEAVGFTANDNIFGSHARTTCAWVNSYPKATFDTILSYGGTASGKGWNFMITADNHLQLSVNTDSITSVQPLELYQWYHVAAVLDGSTVNDITLYINGDEVPVTMTPDPPAQVIDTDDVHSYVWIGRHINVQYGYNYFFQGMIDDVRIYAEALSPEELIVLGSKNKLIVSDGDRYASGEIIEINNDGIMREITVDDNTITFEAEWDTDHEDPAKEWDVIYNWGLSTNVFEDYHLRAESPCIDVGDPNEDYSGQVDPDGDNRVIDIYNKGDGSNDVDMGADEFKAPVFNETQQTGYLTIQSAINDSANGDVIVVSPGTYYENVNFNGKNITVQSLDPYDWDIVENTVIEGTGTTNAVQLGSGASHPILSGFTVTGGTRGVYCMGTNYGDVNHCILTGNSGAAILLYGASAVITNCVIRDNDSEGISMGSASGTFKNNLIYGNDIGVSIELYASGNIYNCTIADNTSYGVIKALTYAGATIKNCILWDNDDDLENCTATYSCYSGASGTGNIDSDIYPPDFVDDDYHLDSDSPCIDVGDNSVVVTGDVDIDGEDRVMDGDEDETAVVDIGADEYNPD